MLSKTDEKVRGLADLPTVESDSLLALIEQCAADPRDEKIDVGVGVFRDDAGATPILKVIKDAEAILQRQQETKAYLGPAGDRRFVQLLRPILLGEHGDDDSIAGLQTPGGCGALRLGFELIATVNPRARVLVGTPTWPNHPPIIEAVGLEVVEYPYYDRDDRTLRFDAMMSALNSAEAGDVVLLHGCCHNPTGADPSREQWQQIAATIAERRLLPFVDIAYQGFGRGLDEDAYGLRLILESCGEVIAAQSCDKNFSVYRDRVGSLWIKTGSSGTTASAMDHVKQRAREMWSMPPDHGAAAVRIVLDTPELKARWHGELDAMRDRINAVRARIASADGRLAYIGDQLGMFSILPIRRDQVLALRDKHAIYMADSGRFNVVGLSDAQIDRFISSVVEVLDADG